MIQEIFRTYMILLMSDSVTHNEKIILSKDALEVSERLLSRMEKECEGTIPWNKLRLLRALSTLFNKGVVTNIAVEQLFSEHSKWIDFKTEVLSYANAVTDELELNHFKKQLIFEKQYVATEQYVSKFKSFIERVENREFEDLEEIQGGLKNIVEELYMGFVRENNLAQALDGVKIIDYDDPTILLSRMQEFYDGHNYISSGYKNIDTLFGGGFERTRLYLLAGKPGSGKSTFLLNFMHNMGLQIKNGTYKDNYILYLSLENLALETNQRLLCKHLNITKDDLESQIRTNDPSGVVKQGLIELKDSNIIIAYFPARTFGSTDLFSYVEKLNMEKGKKPLAIIVDYLDLMKLPTYCTEMRHQLGDITLSLKSLAVMHKVPVLSATQLLKGAYDNKPTLGSIKESSEKIDHSDAIGLINRLDHGDDLESHIEQFGYNVEVAFDKSRASANGTLKFAMLLNKFSILEEMSTAFNSVPSKQHDTVPPRSNQDSKQSKKTAFSPISNQAFNSQSQPLPPSAPQIQETIAEPVDMSNFSI